MKIGLFGYGKMGRLLEHLSESAGDLIVARVNSKCSKEDFKGLEQADVCIDFSHPSAVIQNVKVCGEIKKNIVIGTTGWEADLSKVKDIVLEKKIGLIHSPNFSIGIFLFMQIIHEAAILF